MKDIIVLYYLDIESKEYYDMLYSSLVSLNSHKRNYSAEIICAEGMTFPSDIKNNITAIRKIEKENGYYTRNKHKGYATHGQIGNTLYLDVDTIIQRPFDSVFEDEDWMVALPERNIPLKGMEFNSGVVFSRTPDLWKELYKSNIHYNSRMVETYFSSLVKTAPYMPLKILSPSYNWAPRSKNEDVSHAHIVHYKGNRKSWMPIKSPS